METINKIEVGRVSRLFRYPVKALSGEELERCTVEHSGIYGDRSLAFAYAERPDKWLATVSFPELLSYRAQLLGEHSADSYSEATVHSGDGRVWRWNDRELIDELQSVTGRNLVPIQYPRSGAARAYWEDPVLLTTDLSLEKLEHAYGKVADIRRFRPNIHIALHERRPFAEKEWIGKKLMIGSALLQANKSCDRCGYINIDPESLETDTTLLETVKREYGSRFGLYASVIHSGTIRVNEKVYLVP